MNEMGKEWQVGVRERRERNERDVMKEQGLTFPTPTVTFPFPLAFSNALSTSGLPVASIEPSIPFPPLTSNSAAFKSLTSLELIVWVAPYFLARYKRESTISI